MFKKILIANRGEIALRIIRACRELGIQAAVVYSQADANALFVRHADEAVCIGPASPKESYLNMAAILSAADLMGVDAVHPGYGFLAEDYRFAQVVEQTGLTFIGPPWTVLKMMGNKASACDLIGKVGVPVLSGMRGESSNPEALLRKSKELGYPVMLKATYGGGGKGMREIRSEEELRNALPLVQEEAKSSFGRHEVYVEKYLENVRHVEFQIAGDRYGNIIHLGERECSLQRRHQKMLEEAPCKALSPELREEMAQAAISCARALGFHNIGTIEFLLTEERDFYFIEMNPRLQVEHGVTEAVTGRDLVKMQILTAQGEKLYLNQHDIQISGHAVQCRITAEDPQQGFKPSPGKIVLCHFAGGPGIRVDTDVYPGHVVSTYYDSLLAKLIAWGESRSEALRRLKRALDETEIIGIKTNLSFCRQLLENEKITRGEVNTQLLAKLTQQAAAGRV